MKESVVRPAIVNSFVNEFWFVPHLMRTPVTAVLTDVGHFNATERTPAVAVNCPGFRGFEAICTMPAPQVFSVSTSHVVCAKGRTDDIVNNDCNSVGFAVGFNAASRAKAADTCATAIDVPCR